MEKGHWSTLVLTQLETKAGSLRQVGCVTVVGSGWVTAVGGCVTDVGGADHRALISSINLQAYIASHWCVLHCCNHLSQFRVHCLNYTGAG